VSLSSYSKTAWVNDVSPDIDAAHLLKVEQGIYDVTEEVRLLADPGDLKIVGYAVTAGAEPTGWLLCDGRSVLRATYPDLFSAIGVTYGSADGTHFNLPDPRGRAIVGSGTGTGLTARALAALFGAETIALGAAEMPVHSHTMNHDHALQMGGAAVGPNPYPAFSGASVFDYGGGGASSPIKMFNGSTGNAGSGTAHQNTQPSIVFNVLIKT
jgi:microcystin-dependent protein